MRVVSVGRKAFAHANLSTPPIPPSVYRHLRQKCLSILSTLYVRAGCPLEFDTSGKSLHRHLDIIVSSPVDPEHPPTLALASALSSVKTSSVKTSSVKTLKRRALQSFMVPYPDKQGMFAQVDVEICKPELFDWKIFYLSCGALWDILNTGMRTFGLTANECGLHVLMQENEAVSPRRSLLFLTCDPDAVLRFVGLDVAESRAGWTRLMDMFAFLARNRLMTNPAYWPQSLNSSDQKRKAERGIYLQCFEDWMPSWDNGGGGGSAVCQQMKAKDDKNLAKIQIPQRTAVLQGALDLFGKRAEYDATMVEWKKQRLGQEQMRIRKINISSPCHYRFVETR